MRSRLNGKVARDGEEACGFFDNDLNCDLVVTKVKMREINGNDIALYIRSPQKPQTPILAIGGIGNTINSVLRAPLKLKVLGERVASFLPPPITPV